VTRRFRTLAAERAPREHRNAGSAANIPAALGATPNFSRRRAFALALLTAVAGSLTLAGVASADLLTPESGGSPNADSIDTLYKVVLAVAAVVFVGVEGVLIYSMFKFRARKGAVAAQIRGNTRLEIGWTVGAAIILVVLAVVTFVLLDDIRNPPNTGPDGFQATDGVVYAMNTEKPTPPDGRSLDIDVNGQQYIWRYTYPDGDRNPLNNTFAYEELVVPTETVVTLAIRAQDVAHSWWIPKLGGKMDAVPGHTNYTWFKIPAKHAGTTFRGQCAELCGRNHANMTARVRAVTPQDFEQYLATKRREIQQANEAARDQRREVEGQQTEGEEQP
jgi:cytochrome c oxidase subunit II